MISAFFIFSQKGEVLISRLYRTDFKRSIADVFRIQVISNSDVRSPIITLGSTSFFHVRINSLYVVAVTKSNANAALIFEYCYRFINICKSYFGKIDEESIKNNFVLIYELIDETIDFGYPQNSEIDTLKTYITTESIMSSSIAPEESSKITTQATGATSWRRGDVKYKKNEAFVDVVETVNLSMSAKGTVLRADVDGHIQMRAYLSGTPECKFGLNDKLVIDKNERGVSDAVELDDCHFHQCVRLDEFDASRTISFIPPDGEFELMRYRSTSNVKLPLRIIPTVTEVGTTQVTYTVTVKTNFNNKLSATNVVLRIPTPLNTTNVDCKVGSGKAKYVPGENVVVWKVPRIQGGQECTFTAAADLTSTTNRQVWARPPIDVDFQVLMFTASGLIVRFLKVFERSNYHSIKWVRYLTKANGSYQVRHYDDLLLNSPPTLMFWRFGFNKASSIDSLLDKEDVSLEAILDEDELLQECKAQNTRLNDYFQRVDVLQKLLGYVTGQIEGEEKGRFKYPYVATEVLCSEIWSIVETCINHKEQLLVPFWETVLDRSTEDMKTQVAMASHFAKVNAVFLNKKPNEMLAFIQAQPSVVERILRHVETPSFVDLLVRILQLDERCTGVLEWLSSEQLMARLIEFLSPAHSSDVHTIVAELIKGIISMATPSPGAGITEGLQNGPASNRFARELAHRDSVTKLAGYMLHDFGSETIPSSKDEISEANNAAPTSSSSKLPNLQSSASSVVNSISIIIELIRKNNSDYFEPFLFHTLRNRLIVVQQQLGSQAEDGRETLEQAMKEMVDRMGVVHLGPVLEIIGEKLDQLQGFLRKPRSLTGEMSTTVGTIVPLTFERYRICELFAELLHCSNMSLLNRHQADHLYDSEGRLLGGLSGLEELSKVIAANSGDDRDRDAMDEGNDEIEPALELPVTSTRNSPSSLDSDDDIMDEPGSSDDDAMEEIVMHDEPSPRISSSPSPTDLELEQPPMIVPSSPNAASLPPPTELAAQGAALSRAASFGSNSDSDTATIAAASHGSRRNSRRATTMDSLTQAPLPIGERLKRRYLDIGILSTLLDLFFEFPWNNFLHSAVYDLIHQILTGNVDRGLNRELAIALFRDARLMHRIVEGQKRNDAECAKPKGVRLGYMGHLTLIAADVITALERFPPDLQLTIVDFAPQTWDDYVTGRYNEAKMNEARLLGGGKPVLAGDSARGGGSQWKIDEADSSSAAAVSEASSGAAQERTRGEFRRSSSLHPSRESSADFGPADIVDEEGGTSNQASTPTFVSFDLHSASNYGSSGSDDDDDDGGWLSRSEFALGNASLASRRQDFERRPLSGFDDVFNPHNSSDDPFSSADDDDDGFGPFSDSAPASGTDPFTFGSSFSDEMEDSAFESFGDFGDFQSSGELTPTGDSWTFASDSSISEGSDGSANSPRNTESPEEESRQSSTSNSSTR